MGFNSALINDLEPFKSGKISWLEHQERLDTFFDEYSVWSDKRKKDICISMLDPNTLKVLKNLILPQTVQDVDYQTIVAKLEHNFYPNKLTRTHYRFKYNHRKQRKLETFFQYVTALRKLITNCGYNDSEIQLQRQIVFGVRDEDLQKQFYGSDMTLTRVFEIGLAYDSARTFKAAPHPRNHKARINRDKTCFRCNESILRKHKNEACPFDWAVCEHCHVKGHISQACKYKDFYCNYCHQLGHVSRICAKKIDDCKKPRQIIVSKQQAGNKENERTLLVTHLRINTTESELRNYFGKYGELKSLKMKIDSNTNKFNGSAEISYKSPKSYKKVLRIKQHML